jgi:lipopolysaccharide transport system ATP-binding protein
VTNARITVSNASVEIPIFDGEGRSVKMRLLGQKSRLSRNDRNLTVQALRNINLDLKSGARLALLGDNGAGKSTMLRMMAGIYHPTSGLSTTVGRISSLLDLTLGIDPEASGLDNIFMRGFLLGLSRSEIQKSLPEIMEFSGLGDFLSMPVRTYSSGMTLRLAFAVCTSFVPDVLLMDEWLSVGDQGFAVRAEERLREMLSIVPIVVIATHSHDLARSICNQAVVLRDGEIVFNGSVDEAVQGRVEDLRQ